MVVGAAKMIRSYNSRCFLCETSKANLQCHLELPGAADGVINEAQPAGDRVKEIHLHSIGAFATTGAPQLGHHSEFGNIGYPQQIGSSPIYVKSK